MSSSSSSTPPSWPVPQCFSDSAVGFMFAEQTTLSFIVDVCFNFNTAFLDEDERVWTVFIACATSPAGSGSTRRAPSPSSYRHDPRGRPRPRPPFLRLFRCCGCCGCSSWASTCRRSRSTTSSRPSSASSPWSSTCLSRPHARLLLVLHGRDGRPRRGHRHLGLVYDDGSALRTRRAALTGLLGADDADDVGYGHHADQQRERLTPGALFIGALVFASCS